MRRLLFVVAIVLAVALAVGTVWVVWRVSRFPHDLRAALTTTVPGVTVESLDLLGTPPSEVIARGIIVPNPEGYRTPAALTVTTLRLRFSPWLWMLTGVVVADVEAESPALTLERVLDQPANWERLWALIQDRAAEAVRIFPSRLVVANGRFDLLDPLLKAEGPVLSLRSVAVQFAMDLLGQRPVVPLTATGDFVDSSGQPVGGVRFDIRFSRTERQATGTVRFEHRVLHELNPYVASRAPYQIVEGDGYADVRGRITAAQEFWCEITLVARTLTVAGDEPILGMPPQALLDHLREPDGSIRFVIEIRGRLSDPAFDFHDQMVRQLDQAIRQRLAERGVAVPDDT